MTRSAACSRLSGRRGGEGGRVAYRAAYYVQRIDEGDPQGVLAGERGGGADQLADGVVGAQECPDLLLGPGGGLGPQHDPGAFHLRLERAQRCLDLLKRIHTSHVSHEFDREGALLFFPAICGTGLPDLITVPVYPPPPEPPPSQPTTTLPLANT